MPAEQIGATASAAKARGLDGKWLIALQNTTIQPPLETLKNRALRERIFKASSSRGQGGPNSEDFDNTAVVAQIVKLRAQRAQLLGYPTHAAYVLEDEGAATPDAVNAMLGKLAPAAVANAKLEARDIQHAIDAEAKKNHTKPFKLEPWDWAYYAEQVRAKRFAFDASEVKPYFEMKNVLENGVFYAAHQLYGISFTERSDLPVYQPDVHVYDVTDQDGQPLAIFMTDYFARDNKNGGAWMTSYVTQSKLMGLKPVVINNLNINKPPEGQPVLLTFDEVTTMFHEFGHALHGMFSNVEYPALAGTAVPRDFVEYPSQYNEMWARDPGVLAHFAKHYQTGKPLPKALLDKVLAAGKFDEGFRTTEYIAAAIVDQSWHQIAPDQAPAADGVMAFEKASLEKAGIDYAPVPPRYHTPYFSHIFAGGYSAGYYAYLWSEVLARDTEFWFKAHGGLTRENGDRFRSMVLSRGRSEDPKTLFENFYGKPADIGPLLEHRGLKLPDEKPAKKSKPAQPA
jgi:peptidyl-dipeptidase Dcp